jgi:putative aldouronate transport system permease protein
MGIRFRQPSLSRSYTRELNVMTLPGAITLFVFSYLPIVGIILAFKDFRYDLGVFGSKFNGFENFEFFFTSMDAWRVTRNTVGMNVVFIITGLAVPFILAVMMNTIRSRTQIKFFQTVMFFPYFLSWAVVAYIVYVFLNYDLGLVNSLIRGVGAEPIDWYAEPGYWPAILALINLWKVVGYHTVIFYAAVISIDKAYIESAALDGATRPQITLPIILPMILPIAIVLLIVQLGRIFRADFGLFYLVTRDSGILYATTDVIDTYVYRSLRVVGDIGMSAAVGLYQSVVGFLLVVGSNTIIRRLERDSAIF